MKNKYFRNKEVSLIYVHELSDFCKKWNLLRNKKVDDIFLFFHGYSGNLVFNGKDMSAARIRKSLKVIKKISGKIYLLSCNGGSKDQNNESVAAAFARIQKGIRVRAVVNGYVYYRNWNQLFSRKPLTKERGAYWADFIYCRYRGRLTMMECSIGRNWHYG